MGAYWMFHYIKHGRSFGPISGAELLELLERDVLQADDLARPLGELEWRPLAELVRDLRSGRYASQPAARVRRSSPTGAETVFTTAPPPSAAAPPPAPATAAAPDATPSSAAPGAVCSACAAPASAGARFCARCGAAVGKVVGCPACTRENTLDAAFCGGCGQSLAGG